MKQRLSAIEKKIAAARARSPRSSPVVRLLAVSKHQPVEKMRYLESILLERGDVPYFGESYVQELREKRPVMEQSRFHLIGRLQKNKVRDAVRYADLIESVDSLELAAKINDEALKQGRKIDIFVEVNISNDEQKAGFDQSRAGDFVAKIAASFSCLSIKGLMTVLMLYGDEEASRRDYAMLRELRDGLMTDGRMRDVLKTDSLELSMGMSDDYDVAVEEGATEVRIGTALFGPR